MAEEQKKQEDIAAEDLATDEVKDSNNTDENTEFKPERKKKTKWHYGIFHAIRKLC